MLIEMSYVLSMIEKRPGSPERPLSDLGHRAYTKFWTRRLVEVLLQLDNNQGDITMNRLQEMTAMLSEDIEYILTNQKILADNGQLNCDPTFLKELLKAAGNPGRLIDVEKVRWMPYNSRTS